MRAAESPARDAASGDAAWKREDRRYHELRAVVDSYDRRVARFYRLDHRRYTLEPWGRRLRAEGKRRVLDFGCGTGNATLTYRAQGLDVVSLDASLTMLAVVREKARRAGTAVRCVAADGDRLPFSDGAFDGVVCTGVLHHMPEPGQAVREQSRVLGDGGLLFISEPFGHTPWFSYPGRLLFALARAIRDRLRRGLSSGAATGAAAGARERPLSLADADAVTGALEAAGFAYNVSRFSYWPYVCAVLPDALGWRLMRLLDALKPAGRGDAVRFEARRRAL